MSFLGFYTEKEMHEAKLVSLEYGRIDGIQQATKKHIKLVCNMEEEFKVEKNKLEEKINVLSELLLREVDKDSVKLEKIQSRTKKLRIKKKCENAILRNRMKKLAYEQQC